jgi:hypothetical protein
LKREEDKKKLRREEKRIEIKEEEARETESGEKEGKRESTNSHSIFLIHHKLLNTIEN